MFVCCFSFFFVCVLFFFTSVWMPISLSSPLVSFYVLFDEVSFFIIYLTCFVLFVSMIFGLCFMSNAYFLSILCMLLFCVIVFSSYNLFFLYFSYEASLIPILFIIMKWGSYPERSLSSIILLVYTSVFTFPFLYFVVALFLSAHSLVFSLCAWSCLSDSLVFCVVVFLTFAVNLPVYGLHYWLPIAHVEAPTFGSMVLAGVLLKLGGVGLVRCLSVVSVDLLKSVLVGYLLVFICFVTLICCIQSDFNRLVAYSSVSHMMGVPVMVLSASLVGMKGLVVIMFMHGVSSPVLFMFVGILYSFISTRQHFLMRGLLILSPLISFLITLTFFFTLSAPPFPSFLSEVFFVVCSMSLWFTSFFFLIVFLFLSIVYNLLWFGSILFSSSEVSLTGTFLLTFNFFLPVAVSLILPVVFSLVFYCV